MIGIAEERGVWGDGARGRGPSTGGRGPRCLLVGLGRQGPALKRALGEEGFRPRLLDDLPDVLEELGGGEVDLVVVSGECDQMQPLPLLELMLDHGGGCTVLLLMDRHCPTTALRALARGASDVVAPPHSAASIALRYHVAGLRRRELPRTPLPERPRLSGRELDLKGRRLMHEDGPVSLSGREFELLTRLLDARGEVVDRHTLLVDIWGETEGTTAVLDATVHRLRRKLERDPTEPRVLTTVRGVGYRLEGVSASPHPDPDRRVPPCP
jgi:two-component system, OmpR family, response regulator RegX3